MSDLRQNGKDAADFSFSFRSIRIAGGSIRAPRPPALRRPCDGRNDSTARGSIPLWVSASEARRGRDQSVSIPGPLGTYGRKALRAIRCHPRSRGRGRGLLPSARNEGAMPANRDLRPRLGVSPVVGVRGRRTLCPSSDRNDSLGRGGRRLRFVPAGTNRRAAVHPSTGISRATASIRTRTLCIGRSFARDPRNLIFPWRTRVFRSFFSFPRRTH